MNVVRPVPVDPRLERRYKHAVPASQQQEEVAPEMSDRGEDAVGDRMD